MKFKVLFFTILLILSSYYICFADEMWCTSTPETVLADLNDTNTFSLYSDSVSDEEKIAFQNYIAEKCLQRSEIIDISNFKCQKADAERYFLDVAMKRPDILVYTIFKIGYTSETNIATAIKPIYLFETKEDDEKARKLMNDGVLKYISLADKFENMLEKLLAVHDELVEDCDYVRNNEVNDDIYHHAYSLFAYKKGVCQSYAQAFYMLATFLGYEVDYCVSNDMNHSWNYIKLDDEWYHLDVTHDDPLIDGGTGLTVDHGYHNHFLCSDDKIHQGGSYVVEPLKWTNYLGEHIICDSDKYESNYIFNMKRGFDIRFREDGKICAEAEYNFVIANASGETETVSKIVNYIYDDLYVKEPMLVSEPFELNSNNLVFYEPIAEIKNPPSLIRTLVTTNGKKMRVDVLNLNDESFKKGGSKFLNTKINGYKIKYMLLDFNDIKPLSKAVVVE